MLSWSGKGQEEAGLAAPVFPAWENSPKRGKHEAAADSSCARRQAQSRAAFPCEEIARWLRLPSVSRSCRGSRASCGQNGRAGFARIAWARSAIATLQLHFLAPSISTLRHNALCDTPIRMFWSQRFLLEQESPFEQRLGPVEAALQAINLSHVAKDSGDLWTVRPQNSLRDDQCPPVEL